MNTAFDLVSRLSSRERQASILETRISKYLERRSGVTMVELARDIPGFAGDEMWGREDQNVVLWADMSPAAIAAMMNLIEAGRIVPTATNWLVYSFDGGVLDMPLADSISRKYSKPHWLPVVFAGNREAV